jgi:hypothetical protein
MKRRSFRSDLKGRFNSWRHDHRRLASNAQGANGTISSARINEYAQVLGFSDTYLEIGVEHGYTLEAVRIATRVGVDPRPKFSLRSVPSGLTVHSVVSDAFFETLDDGVKFEVVFLDGLHTYQQTYRDLINSLRHREPKGIIIIDDVVPSDEVSAMSDLQASISERLNRGGSDFLWHGDVFRLLPILRDHHPEVEFRTVVGAGNEQTVLWRRDPNHESLTVDEATLQEYSQVTYEETFSGGIPPYFAPRSDDDVVREFKELRGSP